MKFLQHKKEKIKNFTDKHAEGPHGRFWLAAVSFAESSFFPVPPDFLLIAVLTTKERSRWFFYSLLTLIFSVLGGLFGYLVGYLFFKTIGMSIVHFYHLESSISYAQNLFTANAFSAIIFSAFMPIPEAYKVAALAAGLFHANIFVFIIASLLGRGARFFAVGYLMKLYGEKISNLVYEYLEVLSIAALMALTLIVVYFVI